MTQKMILTIFEYIALSGVCSSENAPFTIEDFLN